MPPCRTSPTRRCCTGRARRVRSGGPRSPCSPRRWTTGEPGDHLYVPEGVVHAFRHTDDAPASVLMLSAPAAPREDYFIELQELFASGRQVDEQEYLQFLARHDTSRRPDRPAV